MYVNIHFHDYKKIWIFLIKICTYLFLIYFVYNVVFIPKCHINININNITVPLTPFLWNSLYKMMIRENALYMQTCVHYTLLFFAFFLVINAGIVKIKQKVNEVIWYQLLIQTLDCHLSLLIWGCSGFSLQGDQLYMAVCLWYLVKSDLSSVRVYSSEHARQVTDYKVPEKHGHVNLVTL